METKISALVCTVGHELSVRFVLRFTVNGVLSIRARPHPRMCPCMCVMLYQVGANANDDRAEEAVRRSQGSNPSLDIAFRRGGEAMEGSGAPAGVGDAACLGTVAAGQ